MFTSPRAVEGLLVSPRKRQRADENDLMARWCKARDLMLKAHQDAHDGMPLLLSRYVSEGGSRRRRSMSNLSIDSSSDRQSEAQGMPLSSYQAPGQNVLYDIPGELVLAKERKKDTQYWPAKIMRYHPPSSASDKPLYEVLFFDGTVKKLRDDTDMFYTEAQEGFRTCKVRGQFSLPSKC
jgi:hypothetical protein